MSNRAVNSPFILVAPPDIQITGAGQITTIRDIGRPQIQGKPFNEVNITNNVPENFPIGRTVVTWTAEDELGNIQIISVEDKDIPGIKIIHPKNRELVHSKTYDKRHSARFNRSKKKLRYWCTLFSQVK